LPNGRSAPCQVTAKESPTTPRITAGGPSGSASRTARLVARFPCHRHWGRRKRLMLLISSPIIPLLSVYWRKTRILIHLLFQDWPRLIAIIRSAAPGHYKQPPPAPVAVLTPKPRSQPLLPSTALFSLTTEFVCRCRPSHRRIPRAQNSSPGYVRARPNSSPQILSKKD